MFATILRRWRLVTPLVLAVLAIMVVSGGMMMPASAHNIKFHFFGRAYALNDNQPIPNTACDTGYIPLHGGSLDTGACLGALGPGQPGAGVTGGVQGDPNFSASCTATNNNNNNNNNTVTINNCITANSTFGRMYVVYADNTVKSIHGVVSGSITSNANIEGGVEVCISQFGCNILYNFLGVNRGCFSNASIPVTINNWDKANQVDTTAFCADDVQEIAIASCHRHSDGSTQATVGATMPVFNTPAFTEDGQLFYLGDSNGNPGLGLTNESFPISGFVTRWGNIRYNILVTLNEQEPFVDGDLGAISATAVHIVVTNSVDLVKADFYIAHVFAGIHCAKSLGTDQNVGQLVGD